MRWADGDAFELGDWDATFADSLRADEDGHGPENWQPLWGWKSKRPSAAEAKARAKATATAKAHAKAHAKRQAEAAALARQSFNLVWNKCRKGGRRDQEMRSVSDILIEVNTGKAKTLKPNINQRLPNWAKKWGWPARSYEQDTSRSCASKTGGGIAGYVATYDAMRDIYDFVK